MSGSLGIGIGLALLASVALNASYLLQHAGSSVTSTAITPRHPVATFRALLASPAWLAGAALGLLGWAMHIGALSRAPLSLVQAFVAGGLALTVPMASIGLGHRVTSRERRAAALMVVALVLLAIGLGGGRHSHAQPLVLAAWVAALVGGAAALTFFVRGPARSAGLGLAGGLLYGAADLCIKALTGVSSVVTSPWLPIAAVTTCAAFFAFQRGLQTGRPVTVIALMTAATNVTTIAGGFAIFGDPIGKTPLLAAAHGLAFALVGLAAWWLAPAQAALVGALVAEPVRARPTAEPRRGLPPALRRPADAASRSRG
jgi:hypothetical protein